MRGCVKKGETQPKKTDGRSLQVADELEIKSLPAFSPTLYIGEGSKKKPTFLADFTGLLWFSTIMNHGDFTNDFSGSESRKQAFGIMETIV